MAAPPHSDVAPSSMALGDWHLEVVDDDGVVALAVVVPGLSGDDLVGAAFRVGLFNVRLLSHAVEVLVQAVQQEGQQLLAVLLAVAAKLRRKTRQRRLEALGRHRPHPALRSKGYLVCTFISSTIAQALATVRAGDFISRSSAGGGYIKKYKRVYDQCFWKLKSRGTHKPSCCAKLK